MSLFFSKGPISERKFLYNEVNTKNVKSFCYFGYCFIKKIYAKKHLAEQASKVLHGVLGKIC